MPKSTKIVLALIVLFLLVLGGYYGFLAGPADAPGGADHADFDGESRGVAVDRDDFDDDYEETLDDLIPEERTDRGILPRGFNDVTDRTEQETRVRETEVEEQPDIMPVIDDPDVREDSRWDVNDAAPTLDDVDPIGPAPRGPPGGAAPFDDDDLDRIDGGDAGDRSRSGKDALPDDDAGDDDVTPPRTPPVRQTDPAPQQPERPVITPPQYTEYTVRANDSLWTIAEQWFGDGSKWDLIARANPTIDPRHLRIGMVLRLPPRDAEREAPTPIRPSGRAGTRQLEYTVRSADTLSRIARTYYGDPAKWVIIYEANRQTLGDRPHALQPGMTLIIPPAPRGAAPPSDSEQL